MIARLASVEDTALLSLKLTFLVFAIKCTTVSKTQTLLYLYTKLSVQLLISLVEFSQSVMSALLVATVLPVLNSHYPALPVNTTLM